MPPLIQMIMMHLTALQLHPVYNLIVSSAECNLLQLQGLNVFLFQLSPHQHFVL